MEARELYNVTARTAAAPQHSPLHATVPYLFGGFAAMLGSIALALLILTCSYWKLSGHLERGEGSGGERDLEAGEGAGKGGNVQKFPAAMEMKILVIMAGHVKPTHLAKPMTRKTSSFEDGSDQNDKAASSGGGGGGFELVNQESDVQVRIGSTVNHDESSDHNH